MQSGASVSMSARTNFKVKGAIDLVFFCTKNFSESFSHSQILDVFQINNYIG
jgi:hypothetical protein